MPALIFIRLLDVSPLMSGGAAVGVGAPGGQLHGVAKVSEETVSGCCGKGARAAKAWRSNRRGVGVRGRQGAVRKFVGITVAAAWGGRWWPRYDLGVCK